MLRSDKTIFISRYWWRRCSHRGGHFYICPRWDSSTRRRCWRWCLTHGRGWLNEPSPPPRFLTLQPHFSIVHPKTAVTAKQIVIHVVWWTSVALVSRALLCKTSLKRFWFLLFKFMVTPHFVLTSTLLHWVLNIGVVNVWTWEWYIPWSGPVEGLRWFCSCATLHSAWRGLYCMIPLPEFRLVCIQSLFCKKN